MLLPIGNYLKKSINKAGISRQVEAFQICELWKEAIKDIFGEKIADKSQALKFKNGTLTVAVLSSVLAQELRFKEEEIKEKINGKVEGDGVKKIRFEL